MLPFIFLKREYAEEPRSIITTKSLVFAILVCCFVGFALPYIFRTHTKARNKDAYIAGLKINGQNTFSLNANGGEVAFSIVTNGEYYEIVGKCKGVSYPLIINKEIKVTQAGNLVKVWIYGQGVNRNDDFPIISNEKYIRWRCYQFAIGPENNTELVFERDFITGSAYAKCLLSYSR